MSEACEKCGADISFQGEEHANCDEVVRLRRQLEDWERRWKSLQWCYGHDEKRGQAGGSAGPFIGGRGGALG
jgi:hypothetical protein